MAEPMTVGSDEMPSMPLPLVFKNELERGWGFIILRTRNECQQTQSGLKQKSPHGDFCWGSLRGFPQQASKRLAFYPACQSFVLAFRR
jgi:hypothetical protein